MAQKFVLVGEMKRYSCTRLKIIWKTDGDRCLHKPITRCWYLTVTVRALNDPAALAASFNKRCFRIFTNCFVCYLISFAFSINHIGLFMVDEVDVTGGGGYLSGLLL